MGTPLMQPQQMPMPVSTPMPQQQQHQQPQQENESSKYRNEIMQIFMGEKFMSSGDSQKK